MRTALRSMFGRRVSGASGAARLLGGGELDGLSIDFTDASLIVRDTTTTSNAWLRSTGDVQDFWRSRSFTSYASPSPKVRRDSSGNYTYTPHNLQPMSESMKFGSWSWTDGGDITSLGNSDPMGGSAAILWTDTATNGTHTVRWTANITTTTGQLYTASVYVKNGTRQYCFIGLTNGAGSTKYTAVFNLSTGAVTDTSTTGSPTGTRNSIEDVGGGWYRISVTMAADSSATIYRFGMSDSATPAYSTSLPTYNSAGGFTLYFFGAQFNAGPTALSYVPTRAHNICLQSADLATTWVNVGSTESTNATAAPDGTTTADKVVEDGGSSRHMVHAATTTTFPAGSVAVFSVYAKAAERTAVAVTINSETTVDRYGVVFDLSNGTIGTTDNGSTTPTGTSSAITAVGNGWYRCSVTLTPEAAELMRAALCLSDSTSPTWSFASPTYAGDGASGAYFWGAQWEIASSPGKYTATTTAAVYSANYDLPREWGAVNAVTNLCLQSQNFDSATWTKSTASITANSVAAPLGSTTTADSFIPDAGAPTPTMTQTISSAAGLAYTFSVYVKNGTLGNNWCQLSVVSTTTWRAWFNLATGVKGTSNNSPTSYTITDVGGGWYRVDMTVTAGTSTAGVWVIARDADGATTAIAGDGVSPAFYVWGAQLEQASSAGTYLHTTATARTDYFYPTSLACQGLLVEEARTNICLYARDLTQSSWVNSNSTDALTATGVDGVANTASTLTASAANGSTLQNITSASAARSLSMFVKRRTGTGTVTVSHGATTGSTLVTDGAFAGGLASWTNSSTGTGTATAAAGAIALVGTDASNRGIIAQQLVTTSGKFYRISVTVSAYTSGTVFYSLNTGTGANASATLSAGSAATFTGVWRAPQDNAYVVIQTSGSGGNLSVDDISVLEVAETDITSSINSSTWTRVSITNETITNPCVAIKLATSGDEIDVDYCQSEANQHISSPIYTGSASVARAIDSPDIGAYSLISATAGTIFIALIPNEVSATNGVRHGYIQVYASDNERLGLMNEFTTTNVRYESITGGVTVIGSSNLTGNMTNGTLAKTAMSWAADDFAATTNGNAVVTDTAGALPTGLNVIRIGRRTAGACANSRITQVLYLPRAMSDAELQTLTQ
jgi:hypothetical protein